MADYIDVGNILSNAARGAADYQTAVPSAKLDLQAKQMQMDAYKQQAAREQSERDDLAKIADQDIGDPTTQEGMGKLMKSLAESVKVYRRNGDGIKEQKATQDIINLYSKYSENQKRDQEEKTAQMDQAGAVFGAVKTDEDLQQAKELLKKIYPQNSQLYESLTLPQAKLIAAQSKKYLEDQKIEALKQKELDLDNYRKEEEDRKNRNELRLERKDANLVTHQQNMDAANLIRAQASRYRSEHPNSGTKNPAYVQAKDLAAKGQTDLNRLIREDALFDDPSHEANIPKDERKAMRADIQSEIAAKKAEIKMYESAMSEAEPTVPKGETAKPAKPTQQGPTPGTVSKGYRFKGGNPADKNNWEKV